MSNTVTDKQFILELRLSGLLAEYSFDTSLAFRNHLKFIRSMYFVDVKTNQPYVRCSKPVEIELLRDGKRTKETFESEFIVSEFVLVLQGKAKWAIGLNEHFDNDSKACFDNAINAGIFVTRESVLNAAKLINNSTEFTNLKNYLQSSDDEIEFFFSDFELQSFAQLCVFGKTI